MTSPTIDTQSLESLLARIREATGPNRDLDAEIYKALGYDVVVNAWNKVDGYLIRELITRRWCDMPRLSASLDACAALQAAVLPGWTRSVDATAPELGIDVDLHPPEEMSDLRFPHPVFGMSCALEVARGEQGDSECLSWLAAILSALIAKGGGE